VRKKQQNKSGHPNQQQTNKLFYMIDSAHMVLMVAAVLFALGLIGVLTRKNVVFMLISVEIMLNAAGLAFVAAGSKWQQPDGQVMFLFILAMAAAEVSVGLALVLQIYHQHKTLDVEDLKELKD
jgi:NADH-quinone oxidoreductase subunit K